MDFLNKDDFVVRFFEKDARNENASIAAGYPIFDTVLYAEFTAKSDVPFKTRPILRVETRTNQGEVQVNSIALEHLVGKNGENLYRKYREHNAAPAIGLPLSQWPLLELGQVATLKALGVNTLEEFSRLPDHLASVIGQMGMTLRDKAQEWVYGDRKRMELRTQQIEQQLGNQPQAPSQEVVMKKRRGRKPKIRTAELASTQPQVA